MFETYGEEVKLVKNTDYKKVWTLVDGKRGRPYILPGCHYVNRLGYFITKVPWTTKDENNNLSVLA